MTNLMRWLCYLGLFAVPYFSIVSGKVRSHFVDEWFFHIQILPIILIILFGIYSVFVILYRVLTFNDCPEAAKEVQEQIEEARKDLISKGFKFRD